MPTRGSRAPPGSSRSPMSPRTLEARLSGSRSRKPRRISGAAGYGKQAEPPASHPRPTERGEDDDADDDQPGQEVPDAGIELVCVEHRLNEKQEQRGPQKPR